MGNPPSFTGQKVFCFVIGGMIVAFGCFMFGSVYNDYKHPISAHIVNSEDACDVSSRENKNYERRVMQCADVAGFTDANKEMSFNVVKGKSVELSFIDSDGTNKTATIFLGDAWFAEHAGNDEIAINYYPGTPRPIRLAPEFRDALAMLWFSVLGAFFAAAGVIGARVRRGRYVRRMEGGELESAALPNRGKLFNRLLLIVGLVIVVDKFHSHWTGHFSRDGFLLGLLITIPVFLWVFWFLKKNYKKINPNANSATVIAGRAGTRRVLVIMGFASFVLVPMLVAFSSF